jgi:hypothetical protein
MEDFNNIKNFYKRYLTNLSYYCSQIQIQIQIQNIETIKDNLKEKKNLEILNYIKSYEFQNFLNTLYQQICDKLNKLCSKFKDIKINSNKSSIFHQLNDLNKDIIKIKDEIIKINNNIYNYKTELEELKSEKKLYTTKNGNTQGLITNINQNIQKKVDEINIENEKISQKKKQLIQIESQKGDLEKSLTQTNSSKKSNKNLLIEEYEKIIKDLKNNIVIFIELQKYIRKNNITLNCFKDGFIEYLFNINNSDTNLLELYINYLLLNTHNQDLKDYIDIQNLMKELELKNRFYQNSYITSEIIKKDIPKNRNKKNEDILIKSLLKNKDFKYIFNFLIEKYSQILQKETIIELTKLEKLDLDKTINLLNDLKKKYILKENNYSKNALKKYAIYKSKGLFDMYNLFKKDLYRILYNLNKIKSSNSSNSSNSYNSSKSTNSTNSTNSSKPTNSKKINNSLKSQKSSKPPKSISNRFLNYFTKK